MAAAAQAGRGSIVFRRRFGLLLHELLGELHGVVIGLARSFLGLVEVGLGRIGGPCRRLFGLLGGLPRRLHGLIGIGPRFLPRLLGGLKHLFRAGGRQLL